MAEWTNCDLYQAEGIDLVFDLMKPWPIADSSIQAVYASHVLEHLSDPKAFFSELWRVCQPNASVVIRVPYGGCNLAMSDIEHVRPWFATSFCSMQPQYTNDSRCLQHADWAWPFGIAIVQLQVCESIARKMGHWYWRLLGEDWIPYLWNAIVEVKAHLYALKTPEAVAEYCSTHERMNTVPVNYVAWQHQVFGTKPPTGNATLINIADGSLALR